MPAQDDGGRSFNFNDNGPYTVFARVFDKDDGYRDYSATVIVNNVAPTANWSIRARLPRAALLRSASIPRAIFRQKIRRPASGMLLP